MKLRKYQQEAVDNTLEAFKDNQAVLVVMATGLGKTVVYSHTVKSFVPKGRVMMLAHREELITQGQDTMQRVTGVEADIEMGDQWAMNAFIKSEIVVSTIQTQIAGMEGDGRMTRFDPNEFSLLIVDEAHHAVAQSYQKVIKHYQQNPHLKVLGLTATPDRSDELALGKIFTAVSYEYDIRNAIDDGWLVPIDQMTVEVKSLDFSKMRTTAGDLNGKDLAQQMEFEENLHGIASPTIELVGDRKALVFAASVGQAERLTEILNRHKANSAEFICGKTPKEYRRKLLADYAAKRFQYLVNVGCMTEGFDDASIDVVVMARPTESRCLYTQMAGRGTRPLDEIATLLGQYDDADDRKRLIADSGKRKIEIIDFVGNSGRHKLVTSADILGGKYEDDVVELAKQTAKEISDRTGKPVDMMTELQRAESEIARRRRMQEEAERRQHIRGYAQFTTSKVNPFDLFDIMPQRERAWHKGRPATEKQLAVLERNGIPTDGLTFTYASQLIDTIIKRRQSDLCSFKQAKTLRKYDIDPGTITFKDASELIGQLAKNGWQKLAV